MQSLFRPFSLAALIFSKIASPIRAFSVPATTRMTSISGTFTTTPASMTSTRRPMSTDEAPMESTGEEPQKIIRMLALHGSEGTADEFPSRLEAIRNALTDDHQVKLEITAIQAPFSKGDGFAWWTMEPGKRSFTANKYEGFDVSSDQVLKSWAGNGEDHQNYDIVLGHSQGAIMIAALLALGKTPYHPHMGYIFNGVSFPNPYRRQMESLKIHNEESSPPRILFVMGTNDKITPNETGEELRDSLDKAGMQVSTIKHHGGHGVPKSGSEATRRIVEWMLN